VAFYRKPHFNLPGVLSQILVKESWINDRYHSLDGLTANTPLAA